MTVTVAATWTGAYAVASGYFFPYPAARPVQVAVANTPGDWMIAMVTWRQPQAGQGVSISVADDAHNWWEPLGAPSGDTAAAGVTRTAIWYAPAARAANPVTGVTNVQVAATGTVLGLAATIIDVSGLSPWSVLSALTPGYALAATSLALSLAAPASQVLALAAFGTDNNSDTLTPPGGSWTALTASSASNGTDTTADIRLSSYWQVTSAGASATLTSSGALDLSGIIAGILVAGTAPAQPNPAWPVIITELAPGAGPQTPPSQLAWTPLSARNLDMSVTQGKQYTAGQLQAGQGTMTVDNPDGALIPPGTGAFAGIDSGTPVRQRAIIPASPTPWYVPFSGFFQRWPFAAADEMLRGQTTATIADIWAYAAGPLNSMAREEMLLDGPYAAWPLDDPAGSAGASNIAPGNGSPLTLTASKYGTGGATVTWGANSGALLGDSSAKVTASGLPGGGSGMFSQVLAGTSLNTPGYGYALMCSDAGFPAITNGVTVEAWFDVQTDQATGGVLGFNAATSGSLFTSANNYTAGIPVVLSVATGFTLPGGFSAGTVYYVINASGGSYQLSASLGGSAVTVTSAGSGFIQATTPWSPVIFSARNVRGLVVEIDVRNTDGALLMQYRTAAGASHTVVIDSGHDYRLPGMTFVSAAFNRTSYRVTVPGSAVFTSGTFTASLPAAFTALALGGVQDRTTAGGALCGYLSLAGVYPLMLAPVRVLSHSSAALGLALEAACDRAERILEYAGLAGRRWLGQQVVTYEGDLTVSGQDIGGQAAASSLSSIAASTVPAMLYVAPTGDVVYLSKLYAWNQPVKWTLGDSTALGEIPFRLGQFATDYDPSRVVNDVQLTQLDTQSVTVPSGVMASTTMAAAAAAGEAQYGAQPLQAAGYLAADWSSAYTAGSSLADLANWAASVYAKPKNRVQSVTVEASAYPAAQAFWAGASPGDMAAVNVRLPTAATSPLISLTARITQVQRTGQFGQAGTSLSVTAVLDFAPEYKALTCDDAVRGLLDGSNVLPW